MSKEEWKPVKNYEPLYEVSNEGKVRRKESVVEYVWRGKTKKDVKKERVLEPIKRDEYLGVTLSKEGKRKSFLVHRLVAEAFIPNPNNLPQINHKDENKYNNKAENLEWCTASYNDNYGNRNTNISEALKRRVVS